jgi:transcriptional regulator GlxA family with amidase domain
MRYISENFMNPIDTGTVAHAAGISKRSLQDRFTHNTGRTIHEQIGRKRIDHAKELLRTTDYKTAHGAQECGFGSRERLSKSFKQSTGSSPAEYRDMQTSKRALS